MGGVFLDSRRMDTMDPSSRIAAGIAMVPEDRQTSGLIQSLSILANLTISSLQRFTRGPWLSVASEKRAGAGIASDLRIKAPNLRHNIGSLSGGNQQKVVIAKGLMTKPRVLLLDEPTRGVDVGAKREIHSIVKRLAAEGMGILLVSSELEEVRAVASRIVVLARGAITAEFDAAEATDDALTAAASCGGTP